MPINRDSEHWDKVKDYEKSLKKIEPDKEALKKWEDAHTAKVEKILNDYEEVWKDKYEWPQLNKEDGR